MFSKIFMAAVVALGINQAWAVTPKAGEAATYAVEIQTHSGQKVPLTLVREIVSVVDDMVTVKSTTKVGQESHEEVENLKTDQLLDYMSAFMLLINCEQYGGTVAEVTVKAGTFETCHLMAQGGEFWIGLVPFGIVKGMNLIQNGVVYFELDSYQQ